MTKNKFRRRNKLDIILTDSRPVELPKNYSLVYFYNYLNGNKRVKRMFSRIKRDLCASDKCDNLWGSRWHSAPLKFHIYKNRFEMREMSLISPIAMVELPMFLEGYEKQLIALSSDEGFSVRKHDVNDRLKYAEMSPKSGIKYRYSDEKSIESSGDYFTIKPFKYISDFHNSSLWYKLNREYKCFGRIDYSKCFDSIYSHTFTWLVTKNTVDGKNYGKNQYFLNICDKLMQNMNGSVTNGIVVGPEFSRTMMEILAQHIDGCVKKKLFKQGINEGREYFICRYVDDIYIFADEEKTVESIIELYRDEAEAFHFRLNNQKRIVGKLPYSWFRWKESVISVNEYICKTIFNDLDTAKYLIKKSTQRLPNMKMLYQNIIADYPDYQAKITAYVLSTIYKRVKRSKKPFFSDEKVIPTLLYFLDVIFFFYSFTMSYNNTEKIISILDELGRRIPEIIFKDCLHKILCDYSMAIAKANPEDIINLVLLVSMYEIELPHAAESLLADKIRKNNNPLMYAVFLQYVNYNGEKKRRFKKEVETKIKESIDSIYKLEEFFMYKEVWWLILFMDCPLVSESCINKIRAKLEEEYEFLASSDSNHLAKDAKLLVIEYLLNKKEKNKFINWAMKKEELFDYTVFTTFDRTLFNGYGARINAEDDLTY